MNKTYLYTPNTHNLNDIPQNIIIMNDTFIHNIQLQTHLNVTHILYQLQIQYIYTHT